MNITGIPSHSPLSERNWLMEAFQYTTDAFQRGILFWDTMRRRGDIAMERQRLGHPPVLKYDYELVIDGRTLARPVNYMLLKIRPNTAAVADSRKRPFVIVDPRAGHGPGIGGFKQDSEIGFALRAGHPVYFVSFLPRPVPGQTLEDIRLAEAEFIEEVARLHPEADKPCVIANCQAGWAVAMLASVRPEIMGPVVLSGSPLAYWSGASGKNPMRYSGGLLGGKWMESLACDLGNGLFDGIYLVQNFENLNPANSLWSKYYNLYSAIDTEADRFVDFEAWWTGYFLLNAEEMDAIVSDLFIGNKLSRGLVKTAEGKTIDLSSIRSPVIIFASRGDNISPPQQALNWIEDVYGTERSIIEGDRVIIYLIHESIGHLGVFVSGDVARKQYSQIIGMSEMIDSLPPGLYEMMINRNTSVPGWEELEKGEYSVRFETRTVEDIHRLDDGREDEGCFAAVDAVSSISDSIYKTWLGPWVRFFSNDFTAEWIRQSQPLRVQRTLVSSANPFLNTAAAWAPLVREHRWPAPIDNVFRIQEQAASEIIAAALDMYRDFRDTWSEFAFKTLYGSFGWGALFPPVLPAKVDPVIKPRFPIPENAWTSGGQLAAILRMIAAVSLDLGVFDSRSLLIFNALLSCSAFNDVTPTELKASFRLQARLLRLDSERAIEGLRDMLLDEDAKRDAVDTLLEVFRAVPEAADLNGSLGSRLRQVLGMDRRDLIQTVQEPAEM